MRLKAEFYSSLAKSAENCCVLLASLSELWEQHLALLDVCMSRRNEEIDSLEKTAPAGGVWGSLQQPPWWQPLPLTMVGSVTDPQVNQLITTVNDSAFWAGQDESCLAPHQSFWQDTDRSKGSMLTDGDSSQQPTERSQESFQQMTDRLQEAMTGTSQALNHAEQQEVSQNNVVASKQEVWSRLCGEAAVSVAQHSGFQFTGLTKPKVLLI